MSDKKIGQPSDLFITCIITDRVKRYEVLLPVNHKNYNAEKRRITKLWKKRKICFERNQGCAGLNYNAEFGYCIEQCIQLSHKELPHNNLASEWVQSMSFESITIKEIVIFMIK